MIITRGIARQSRLTVRFSNADILGLDTTGLIQLAGPAPLGKANAVKRTQWQSNIVTAYGNFDVGGTVGFIFDDFTTVQSMTWADAGQPFMSGGSGDDFLSTSMAGLLRLSATANPGMFSSDPANEAPSPFAYADFLDLAANGGIYFSFSNGGADVDGGDVANFLALFIDYEIIDLVKA